MTELLTAAQMRAIEQAAIDSGEVTGLELMERAGQGVVDAIFAEWPELAGGSPRAVVLCGPGNNGGDGFVVARLLKEAGWQVEVFLYGDVEKLPPDARVNYERWCKIGLVQSHRDLTRDELFYFNIRIDAVFGTGLSRMLQGEVRDFCKLIDACAPDVCVDIPSGFCADSGRYLTNSHEPRAGPGTDPLVVTFGWPKRGLFLDLCSIQIRKVVCVDIGVEDYIGLPESQQNLTMLVGQSSSQKYEWEHKYDHGHALILSGGAGKGGAARLAARGALRIGAGAVTIGTPPAALIENAAQLNAIMLRGMKDATQLTETLQDKRINALCIGPGLGLGEREAHLLDVALNATRPGLDPGPPPRPSVGGPGSSPGRRLVLDADALTLLAQDKTLFAKLHKNCILTPHAGEFARLFPDIAAKLDAPATKGPAYSKVDATRDAAKRAGCIVLFKGPDTVIADPSGRCSINASLYERSAPWLATAGSGDVLAGFITGLLARGFAPMQAAETGAWLHTECALSFGPGLIAEDLPEELPKVFRALGL